MTTTYDVRIHKTEVVAGRRGNSYKVRWAVAGRRWKEPFRSAALADSFRSELMAASRKGQAFDTATGRPVTMQEVAQSESWYVFACSYIDMKWPDSAGKSRMGIAEALTTVTPILVSGRGGPSEHEMRVALYGWAFNARARAMGEPPAEVNATKLGPEVDLHARHHRRSQGHETILEDLNLVALPPRWPTPSAGWSSTRYRYRNSRSRT